MQKTRSVSPNIGPLEGWLVCVSWDNCVQLSSQQLKACTASAVQMLSRLCLKLGRKAATMCQSSTGCLGATLH